MSLRQCARSACEHQFNEDPAHPRKVYCTPKCRTLAELERKRATAASAEATEIEVDADHVDDIKNLLAERGLDINEWIIVRVTVNRWEGFYKTEDADAVKVPLRQLKVFLRRNVDADLLLQPATVLPKNLYKLRERKQREGSKLIFIYGDDQRPHVDETFEQLKLEWLADNRPDEIIDLGDGMDTPTLSTHKANPAKNWSVQDCADNYATWLFNARAAAPGAYFRILADNHTSARLRDYQLARAAELYGVHPADIAGLEADAEPLWSLRRLLRLDELNIEYIAPPDDTHYAESQVELIPGELVAIHGYRTGQNLGKKFVDDYGCSVIYGHQHGQDIYATDTKRRGVGSRKRLYGIGVGCGAILHGGGGFAPGADWQNCALTVSVFPDGGWTWDYVNYENGVLSWRDRQYTA